MGNGERPAWIRDAAKIQYLLNFKHVTMEQAEDLQEQLRALDGVGAVDREGYVFGVLLIVTINPDVMVTDAVRRINNTTSNWCRVQKIHLD